MATWLTKGRAIRLLAIAVLGFIGVWALFPSLFTLVSNRAVVNSRLATASSAIDGTVTIPPKISLGARVQTGNLLANVVNTTLTTRIEGLRGERKGWRQQLQALREKRDRLQTFNAQLQQTGESYQAAFLERLDARIAEVQAELEAQRALAVQYRADEQRAKRLASSGNASQARVDEVVAQRRQAEALAASKEAILRRLKGERDAARNGLFLADDFNNTPYSEQRSDEVQLRLFDLSGDIAEAKRQITQLEAAIDNEIERQDIEGWATVNAPTSGYVWEVQVSSGEYVERASDIIQIVDCARTFVDVTLSASRLEDVSVDQPVAVELLSSGQEMEGRVVAVRAAANLPDNMALTNKDIGRSFDDLQVLVGVDGSLSAEGNHRFCNVGQRAVVDFDRNRGLADMLTRGLYRVERLASEAF